MRLFLASTFADAADKFRTRTAARHVLFITNPADPFKSKYWMKKDRKAFTSRDFLVDDIDLRGISIADFARQLCAYDVVHVCGGSALYTIDLLWKTGMAGVLMNAVMRGEIIYTGTSAGSMIVAPNVSLGAEDADEKEAGMVGKLKDFTGLALVPYYVVCHNQEKYYVKSTQKLAARLPKNKLPIIMLNDGMAIWQEGESTTILT